MQRRDGDGRKKGRAKRAVKASPPAADKTAVREPGEANREAERQREPRAALAAVHTERQNQLYYGDNLDVLRRHIRDESVDLVYLDPPFNSNANYNVLFAARDGTQAAAQIQAFEDTWQWDQVAAATYEEAVERGGPVADVLRAFRTFLGTSDMLAYLGMMAPRLVELHRVLKPKGSLYLHCDPTASHYLKLLLDAVFGPEHFRNEIVWKRTSGRKGVTQYGRVHDIILFYTKSDESTWNAPTVPQTEETARGHDLMRDEKGRLCRISDLSGMGQGPPRSFGGTEIPPPAGRHWAYDQEGIDDLWKKGRIFINAKGQPRLRTPLADLEGIAVTDVWTDIEPINSAAKERLGYPTQKPESLLERIVAASSAPGSVVLDPFCGCGTTIAAAQKLQRGWIGIDVTHLAIGLIKTRLRDAYGDSVRYEVIGEPVTVEDAARLAEEAPYQFQAWALGLVGARQGGQIKKGADKGIDGRLYFHDGPGKTRQIVLSVKAGKLHANYVRDLEGVRNAEQAEIGVLISFDKPTQPMRSWAAGQGFYESPWGRHPRLQLITIAELLEGKQIDAPRTAGTNVTYKAAPKIAPTLAVQRDAFDE